MLRELAERVRDAPVGAELEHGRDKPMIKMSDDGVCSRQDLRGSRPRSGRDDPRDRRRDRQTQIDRPRDNLASRRPNIHTMDETGHRLSSRDTQTTARASRHDEDGVAARNLPRDDGHASTA